MSTKKLRVGDELPGIYPSIYSGHDIAEDKQIRTKLKARQRLLPWEHKPVHATVEYIHPLGRYIVARFRYEHGSFCEAVSLGGGQA